MKRLLIFILLLVLPVVSAQILINEILSDPGTNSYDEWIEIYNQNNLILNLSDWKVNDSTYTYDITCYNVTNCSLITNSTYFIIIWKKANISAITNNSITYYNSSGLGNYWLTNNGETLIFYNSSYSTNISYTSSGKGKSWARIPDGDNNWTICSNPTPGAENNCSASSGNATNITSSCDLLVSIETDKFIYTYGDDIKYKIKTEDISCNNTQHEYSINYWIKDLFSNYLKEPYAPTYNITCQKTKSYQKKAPEICGSEVYYIEAQITEHGCNDTNSLNDFAQQMIIIKGLSPESSSCKNDKSASSEESTSSITSSSDFVVDVTEILLNATQGQVITTKVNLTNKYASAKTIQVYSYIYEGQKLITEGGWTANRQEFSIRAGDTKTIELKNTIKQDAQLGTYNFRIRTKVDGKNIDKTQSIEILEGELQIQESQAEQSATEPHQANSVGEIIIETGEIYKPFDGKLISGKVIWSSKTNRNINISMLVFIAALLILTIALIFSYKR